MKQLFWVAIVTVLGVAQTSGQVLVHEYEIYNSSNSLLADNTIHDISIAPDSAVWVATDWGIVVIRDTGWTLLQTTNSGIPGDGVRAIAFDHQGRPWIATAQKGVGYLADTGWVTYNTSNSLLPNNDTKAIAFDTSGQAWIGTLAGIACVCDTGWAVYNMNNSTLNVNNIGAIAVDDTNTLWFGTLNGGLTKFDGANWRTYSLWNSQISDNTIHEIYIAPNGIIWLATPAGGLCLFNGSTFQVLNTQTSGIGSNSLFDMAFDTAGLAYLATNDKGLVQYSGSSVWQQFGADTNADINGVYLPQNDLLSVAIDKQHTIWVGTHNMGLVSVTFSFQDTTGIGITRLQDHSISIYPNPCTDAINIDLSQIPRSDVITMQVLDITGAVILSGQLSRGTKKIPLNDLSRGIYFMVIRSEQGVQTFKLFKE